MKRLVSGDIIELYIEQIQKYCYLKYIDRRKYIKNVSCPFQFSVSNYLSQNKVKAPCDIEFSYLLFSPWHLMGHKELIRTGKWMVVGRQELFEFDFQMHHYKMIWPPNLLATPKDAKSWRVLKDIDNVNEGVIVPFENCAHLEYYGNHGALNLELRIVVEQLKIKEKLSEIDKSGWDRYDYILFEQFKEMPIYTRLPQSLQGRLIE